LEFTSDPNLIVGLDRPDDAGVYRLRDDLAIIQTVDFFTPIVDDPFLFGQIAAANALSDVYAMGGKPICAMNIAGFPSEKMEISVLHNILRGGLEKLREAEVVLAGGHTVEDPELKFGLSVTGLVHPDRVLTNRGARAGDQLVLTKPLGTGIVNTAIKGELATPEAIDRVTGSMGALNRAAAEQMVAVAVHACTDITGFGLIGHICEMIEEADVGVLIDAASVPVFAEAIEYARMGLLPAGLYRNREFREGMVDIAHSVPPERIDLFFDPQTSGGLLIAVVRERLDALIAGLHGAGVTAATRIGEVTRATPGRVVVH